MKRDEVTVLIPTYNGAKTIGETLESILTQDFKHYSILVHDDASTDNTLRIIRSYKYKKIHIFRNRKNVGCQKNMESARKKVKKGIVFLMAQDDILAKGALGETIRAFDQNNQIGMVTRPYFWFDTSINKPVRITSEINPKKNEIVSMRSEYKKIEKVIETIGQISGLAYRAEDVTLPIHTDIFTGHAYLFASILKKKRVVFLKDLTVAVRIQSSQSRHHPGIYEKSPLQSWVDFTNSVFCEKRFEKFRRNFIQQYVAKNYIGLLQIKNYSKFSYVRREISLLIKYRWQNVYNPQFIAICALCVVFPKRFLAGFVDWYKRTINAQFIKPIKFERSFKQSAGRG